MLERRESISTRDLPVLKASTHQLLKFPDRYDQITYLESSSERCLPHAVKARTHKETHVNVTGSVTLPLPEAVLSSSGRAEGTQESRSVTDEPS